MNDQQQKPVVFDPAEYEVLSDDEYEVLPEEDFVGPKQPPTPTWSDRLGLNTPVASSLKAAEAPMPLQMLAGFGRGASAAAVDLAQGAVGEVSNLMQAKDTEERRMHERFKQGGTTEQWIQRERDYENRDKSQDPKVAPWIETPPTAAGTIGSYAPHAAALAYGGPKSAKPIVDLVPRAGRAAQKFESVLQAAKDVPVDMNQSAVALDRLMQLKERGGKLPSAAKRLFERLTDPAGRQMQYDEVRDFISNLSSLSPNEFARLNSTSQRQVAVLKEALNAAAQKSAGQVGRADDYASAMKEFANAARLKKLGQRAAQGAGITSGAGAGYWLLKKLGVIGGGASGSW